MNMEQQFLKLLSESDIEFSTEPIIGEDDKYHYFYQTTNLINNKKYFGIHTFHNPHDGHYKGSGLYVQSAFNKYGFDNFINKPVAYFKTRLDLMLAEQLLISDEFLEKHRDKVYNLAVGGFVRGTFESWSKRMSEEYGSDYDFETLWNQLYQQSKNKAGYKSNITKQLKAMLFPDVVQDEYERRKQSVIRTCSKPVIITNKQTGEQLYFGTMDEAEKFLNCSIRALLRGSKHSPLSEQYTAKYVKEEDQQKLVPIEYKEQPKLPSHSKPVTCYDVFGNEVKQFPTLEDAGRWAHRASKGTTIQNAIIHQYLCAGYMWNYTRQEDRDKTQYKLQTKCKRVWGSKQPNGNPEVYYCSLSEACTQYNVDPTTFKRAIKNQTQISDYYWRYVDPVIGNMNKQRSGPSPMAKKVGGSLTKDGEVVVTFDNAQAASKHFNKCLSAVSTSIRTSNRCAGYYWRYLI